MRATPRIALELRFSCESCQTRYTIADEKVRGRVLKVRCKTCGAAIMVRETGARTVADPAGASTPPDGMAPATVERPVEWYAMISGKQEGPFPQAELEARLAQGTIGRRTYLWNESLPEWRRAEDLPAILPLLPPPPAAPATPGPPTPGPGAVPIPTAAAAPAAAPAPAISTSRPPGGHGEQTRMVMMQAGVDARGRRRRTARILAGAAALLVAVVAIFLFMPASMLPPAPRAAGGEEPVNDPSLWTAEGMEGLRSKLLGRSRPEPRPAPRPAGERASAAAPSPAPARDRAVIRREESRPAPRVPAATRNELAALYADDAKKDVKVAKVDAGTPKTDGAALDQGAVARTIADSSASYKRCMDDYLRRNPGFRGGKIQITATIAPSGIVTSASLSDRSIDSTDLGTCLKDRTKRIIFPKFSGEPFDVSYPLVLASGG